MREPGRVLLFDTGIGAFFEPRLRERYGVVESGHVLVESLAAEGLTPEQIDVVVLSHLHFDHAGGLLAAYEEGRPERLLFPRARFVTGARHWPRAREPHARDRASFIAALPDLLEQTGRLELVDGERSATLGEGYRLHYSGGHTPGLMMTESETGTGPLVFVGDLIPGAAWMHLPITIGYDRYPEKLIDEKRALLGDLLQRGGSVFFTHDPRRAFARVARDGKGRFCAGDAEDDV